MPVSRTLARIDIICAILAQNAHYLLIAISGSDRHDCATSLKLVLVVVGILFWDAHIYQSIPQLFSSRCRRCRQLRPCFTQYISNRPNDSTGNRIRCCRYLGNRFTWAGLISGYISLRSSAPTTLHKLNLIATKSGTPAMSRGRNASDAICCEPREPVTDATRA